MNKQVPISDVTKAYSTARRQTIEAAKLAIVDEKYAGPGAAKPLVKILKIQNKTQGYEAPRLNGQNGELRNVDRDTIPVVVSSRSSLEDIDTYLQSHFSKALKLLA